MNILLKLDYSIMPPTAAMAVEDISIDEMLFQPQVLMSAPPADMFELVYDTGEEQTNALSRRSATPEAPYSLILSVGNAMDIVNGGEYLIDQAMVKWANFASGYTYDYPGFGTSTKPSTAGALPTTPDACVAALAALINHVLDAEPDKKLVLWGHSIGTCVTMRVLSEVDPDVRRDRIAHVLLTAPLLTSLSVPAWASCVVPEGWTDPFPSGDIGEKLAEAGTLPPCTIYHGTMDHMVPLDQGEQLATKLKCQIFILHWNDHCTIMNTVLDKFRLK